MLVAGNEKLRFEAVMLSSNDADKNRKFIISIRLSDDLIGNGLEKSSKSVISEFIDGDYGVRRLGGQTNRWKAIQEIQSRNSGLSAGRFLEYSRIPKPGSSINSPVYYGLNDFAINNTIIGIFWWIVWNNACVSAFSHRFKITGCDLHVLKWIEAHPEGRAQKHTET